MRHIGTVIGNHLDKQKYVTELVTNLNQFKQSTKAFVKNKIDHNQDIQYLLVVLKVN